MQQLTPLELNADFNYALDILENTQQSIFITGKAGTGKSTLLQLFKNTTRKKTVVLAPTGVAALNVQGQTIHSFFRLPAKPIDKSELNKLKDRRVIKSLELLIIDEISMVRADLLDLIDYSLRLNRDSHQPFGGVQMVFFGDLFQLPPVIASKEEEYFFKTFYDSPYFFSAKIFSSEKFELQKLELKKAYRQESRHFLRLLDAVRVNQFDFEDLEDLNERFIQKFESDDLYITLSTRNIIVDKINNSKLSFLEFPEIAFTANISGNFDLRQFPTDATLRLKEGAQVMFLKNDTFKKYVNGTIGKVVKLTEKNIVVEIINKFGEKEDIEVEPYTWEMLEYKLNINDPSKIDTKIIGTFTQYPLRLAWAITIHKSQGKTFDKVIIDLGQGAFEFGQTYVALSRCRTIDGIVLKQKIKPSDILVDERVIDYYQKEF